jgi:hypothetical protein
VFSQGRTHGTCSTEFSYLALLAAALLLLLDLAVEGRARVGVAVEAAAELEARDVARLRRGQDAFWVLQSKPSNIRIAQPIECR